MRKLIIGVVTAGTLALPSVAAAREHHPHPVRNAAREQCTAERAQIGVTAFRQKYGPRHAFRNCVRAHRPSDRIAAEACRAERRAIGDVAFRQKYGERHALRTCIESKTVTPTA